MGFRIEYSQGEGRKVPIEEKSKSQPAVKRIAILVLACVFLFIGAQNISSVEEFLIPGEPEVTKAAFSSFIDDLQQGSSFRDAITVFCREIIQNAQNKYPS